jgi:hypothetical protein
MSSADEILVVEDLKKHFPVTRGIIFQKEVATVKAVGTESQVRVHSNGPASPGPPPAARIASVRSSAR